MADPSIVVVAAVIEQHGRVLLTRRLKGTHLEGLWEFPGGKCSSGESHADALRRELREELDTDAAIGAKMFEVTHEYPDRRVELHFYACTLDHAPRPLLGQEMRWAERAELAALEFPPADRELIQLLSGQIPSRRLHGHEDTKTQRNG